jgi:hypothetical protein
LRGNEKGGLEGLMSMAIITRITLIPLILPLSPKGRGEITFENTIIKNRR